MFKPITITSITLIPKIKHHVTIKEYSPIFVLHHALQDHLEGTYKEITRCDGCHR